MSCCAPGKKKPSKKISIPNIIRGHINKAISGTSLADRAVEDLAEARIKICKACLNDDGEKCITEKGNCCRCGCDIEAKIRVRKEQCPIKKW